MERPGRMVSFAKSQLPRLALAGLFLLALAAVAWFQNQMLDSGSNASAEEPAPPATETHGAPGTDSWCLGCHSNPDLEMTFPNGDVLPLTLDIDEFRHSVHGNKLTCADCHQNNLSVPHDSPKVNSRRDLSRVEYESCKRCHFDNYTRTLDSMHFDAMAEGEENAPLCTDCHKPHSVVRLTESRSAVTRTCSDCHDDVFDEYLKSAHGSALSIEDNPDVPVCIDCHGVHNIESANTASFRQASVNLCAGCHSDKELMDEYEISSDVFKTYLDDFHGKTVGFYQEEGAQVWPDVAVCTDCHGVHDIERVENVDSAAFKENLVTTCQQCHDDATTNFSAAWLSHYEPSPDKAPLVWAIKNYYAILIPAMMVGLAMNIALDLWRLARNR